MRVADPTTRQRSWPLTLAIGAGATIVLAAVGAPRHRPVDSEPLVSVSPYVVRPDTRQPRAPMATRTLRADLVPYYVHPSLLETPLHDEDPQHVE